MQAKTFWGRRWFVAEVGMFFAACFTLGAESREPTLHVAVHNDAGVSELTVAEAESAAGKVFASAGLRLDWVNCGRPGESDVDARRCSAVSYPTHLQLRILVRPRHLAAATLGISYLGADGTGCYSEIFAAQVEHLGVDHEARSVILGHVMAHELAHLLLGTNSHATTGIMRAHWQAAELERAKRGVLLFSAGESERMRERAFPAWTKVRANGSSRTTAAD